MPYLVTSENHWMNVKLVYPGTISSIHDFRVSMQSMSNRCITFCSVLIYNVQLLSYTNSLQFNLTKQVFI